MEKVSDKFSQFDKICFGQDTTKFVHSQPDFQVDIHKNQFYE